MGSAVDNFGEDGIPEHFLCPICFELPESEVYQCVDGHVLCKACFLKLKECPHCRRSFGVTPPIRNRHFEAELENLKANCPFNSNGCRTKLARNVLDSHKATCPYNFEKFGQFANVCKFIGFDTTCEFLVNKGNTKDAVEHLVAKHGCVLTEKTSFQIELTSFDEGSSGTNSKWIWTPVISKQNNSFVLFVPSVNSKNALVWLAVLLDQLKSSEVFEVEFTLRKDSKRFTYADIPLTLSKMERSPLENDPIFSQSPFQLSWLTLNFGESLIVDIKIRENEDIKDEKGIGKDRIICAKNIVPNPPPPPPSCLVTFDKEKLFSLAINGDLQSFKSFVKEAPQYKNIKNSNGESLLHLTMFNPYTKVGLAKAKFLVEEMNADIFELRNSNASLLHYAAQYGDDKAVKYFLEKGLDVNAAGEFNRTPLHYACHNYKFGGLNAKMLLRYSPNCTLKDHWGETPLEFAESEGRQEIANLIRKASRKIID